jgi:hypothetical protein
MSRRAKSMFSFQFDANNKQSSKNENAKTYLETDHTRN